MFFQMVHYILTMLTFSPSPLPQNFGWFLGCSIEFTFYLRNCWLVRAYTFWQKCSISLLNGRLIPSLYSGCISLTVVKQCINCLLTCCICTQRFVLANVAAAKCEIRNSCWIMTRTPPCSTTSLNQNYWHLQNALTIHLKYFFNMCQFLEVQNWFFNV